MEAMSRRWHKSLFWYVFDSRKTASHRDYVSAVPGGGGLRFLFFSKIAIVTETALLHKDGLARIGNQRRRDQSLPLHFACGLHFRSESRAVFTVSSKKTLKLILT